jgi:hypothetical protein
LIDKELNQIINIDNSIENILSNLTLHVSDFLNPVLLADLSPAAHAFVQGELS